MLRPFVIDAAENELCETCAGFLCSLGCGRVCPPTDRLPFKLGVVHATCSLRLSNSMGYQAAAMASKRLGTARGVS